jgi:hypothetical protein
MAGFLQQRQRDLAGELEELRAIFAGAAVRKSVA